MNQSQHGQTKLVIELLMDRMHESGQLRRSHPPLRLVKEKKMGHGTRRKRGLDFMGALCGLILCLPVLVILGVLIKLSSRGPIFYSQDRVGEGGKIFRLYKLRSMYINADGIKAQLMAQNEVSGPAFKMKHDPRVTPIGRFIRRHSLDELPQLWNVLKGDMSLVGPRPALVDEVKKWNTAYFQRLKVPQGLTCIWQTSGRSNLSFESWMELDLEYVNKQSISLDLKLILKTITVVARGTGAY
ncbi:sugar transferase [Pseudobacteriovorax antillogorgiicola]|uniref:Sugar transferase involved in LPS biosynthesis (Colanic, teichoic acid) n=1 Tax=Pseudobacteriovorax antillogorgiicola TaxID=1513793 RepID=A0A1Y6CYG6_9BACT|nr:sugar transferase [Pseudobacteriovorax antillogorgiicola]TCS42111.1 lipopolysaccharide/colanic/teichoic acid biosynthesis glycosyltransferase [Pseudobacteriovorax antillogorgiicola]SMF83069.1 Sugar transferase involved in LPS biosynthesis (colanic, teichoic acid) [Pseudobacteriovorax antillogorgiicola]